MRAVAALAGRAIGAVGTLQIKKCGSGLARESGLSVNKCLADPPHSRASPLPQGSCGGSTIVPFDPPHKK
ncbi:hypothetical protein DA482_11205 [Pseudomonas fluorescens]|nr:hypothetical protein D0N73_26740 [Pseudomonas fluorescens]TWR43828.1 hypothetical protein FIP59_27535 [Pseudomonas fluorescens]